MGYSFLPFILCTLQYGKRHDLMYARLGTPYLATMSLTQLEVQSLGIQLWEHFGVQSAPPTWGPKVEMANHQ